jgi:hypothetical protein
MISYGFVGYHQSWCNAEEFLISLLLRLIQCQTGAEPFSTRFADEMVVLEKLTR